MEKFLVNWREKKRRPSVFMRFKQPSNQYQHFINWYFCQANVPAGKLQNGRQMGKANAAWKLAKKKKNFSDTVEESEYFKAWKAKKKETSRGQRTNQERKETYPKSANVYPKSANVTRPTGTEGLNPHKAAGIIHAADQDKPNEAFLAAAFSFNEDLLPVKPKIYVNASGSAALEYIQQILQLASSVSSLGDLRPKVKMLLDQARASGEKIHEVQGLISKWSKKRVRNRRSKLAVSVEDFIAVQYELSLSVYAAYEHFKTAAKRFEDPIATTITSEDIRDLVETTKKLDQTLWAVKASLRTRTASETFKEMLRRLRQQLKAPKRHTYGQKAKCQCMCLTCSPNPSDEDQHTACRCITVVVEDGDGRNQDFTDARRDVFDSKTCETSRDLGLTRDSLLDMLSILEDESLVDVSNLILEVCIDKNPTPAYLRRLAEHLAFLAPVFILTKKIHGRHVATTLMVAGPRGDQATFSALGETVQSLKIPTATRPYKSRSVRSKTGADLDAQEKPKLGRPTKMTPQVLELMRKFIYRHSVADPKRRTTTRVLVQGVSLKEIKAHLEHKLQGFTVDERTIATQMVAPHGSRGNANRYKGLVDARVPTRSNTARLNCVDAHYCNAMMRLLLDLGELTGIPSFGFDAMHKLDVGSRPAVSRMFEYSRFFDGSVTPTDADHDFHSGHALATLGVMQFKHHDKEKRTCESLDDLDQKERDRIETIARLWGKSPSEVQFGPKKRDATRTTFHHATSGPAKVRVSPAHIHPMNIVRHLTDFRDYLVQKERECRNQEESIQQEHKTQMHERKEWDYFKYLICQTDGGIDYTGKFLKNIVFLGRFFRDLKLKFFVWARRWPGGSSLNYIEHLWAPLCRALKGVILDCSLPEEVRTKAADVLKLLQTLHASHYGAEVSSDRHSGSDSDTDPNAEADLNRSGHVALNPALGPHRDSDSANCDEQYKDSPSPPSDHNVALESKAALEPAPSATVHVHRMDVSEDDSVDMEVPAVHGHQLQQPHAPEHGHNSEYNPAGNLNSELQSQVASAKKKTRVSLVSDSDSDSDEDLDMKVSSAQDLAPERAGQADDRDSKCPCSCRIYS
jgi:hypothetical protein